MSKKQELSAEEIISFGLRHIYGRLIKEGYEILSVRPEPNIDPQILAKKEEQLYFIIVRTEVFPNIGDLPSISRIKQIRKHANTHDAKCKFASLGIMNANAKTEEEKSKLYKSGEFYINYSGLHELIRSTADQ